MRIRIPAVLAVVPAMLVWVSACDQPAAPPAKRAPATKPSATNSPDLNRYLEGQKPTAPSDVRPPQPSRTPPDHPVTGIPTPPPAAGQTDLKWDVPEGWTTATPSSSVRRAQYGLPRADGDTEDGELVVYYFGPGQGGTVETNLVRWRGQFTTREGQPVPESDVKNESFDANGLRVTLLDVSGRYAPGQMPNSAGVEPRDNQRMLAAVVETPRGAWFFKATGPKATMEKHADAVRTMLRSARP
jgi:hypothetical protein